MSFFLSFLTSAQRLLLSSKGAYFLKRTSITSYNYKKEAFSIGVHETIHCDKKEDNRQTDNPFGVKLSHTHNLPTVLTSVSICKYVFQFSLASVLINESYCQRLQTGCLLLPRVTFIIIWGYTLWVSDLLKPLVRSIYLTENHYLGFGIIMILLHFFKWLI